jgi:hypothetical protein
VSTLLLEGVFIKIKLSAIPSPSGIYIDIVTGSGSNALANYYGIFDFYVALFNSLISLCY